MAAITGQSLERVERLHVVEKRLESPPANAEWVLRGVTSYERYVTAAEQQQLRARQPPVGRPEATRAALIPIRKSDEWWQLPHDERRRIFEDRSAHIATGLRYLPAVARRLHHGYELGEPFDFLTWFEFAPGDAHAFEELVGELRRTEEWRFVIREVDVRVERD